VRVNLSVSIYVSLIFSIVLSNIALADGSEKGKVKNIIVESDNIISVVLDGPDYTTECSGGGRWTISTSDKLYKEKYSAILAAASSGKTITLFHLGGLGCGNWDSNKVYYVNTEF